MTTDDFGSLKKSRTFSSYEEADLNGKKSILYTKCNLEPNNVKAWITFIRLQVNILSFLNNLNFIFIKRELMAHEETGDSSASVKNTKALYERQCEILANALSKNPASVELAMEKIHVMEAYPEVGSANIAEAWKKV